MVISSLKLLRFPALSRHLPLRMQETQRMKCGSLFQLRLLLLAEHCDFSQYAFSHRALFIVSQVALAGGVTIYAVAQPASVSNIPPTAAISTTVISTTTAAVGEAVFAAAAEPPFNAISITTSSTTSNAPTGATPGAPHVISDYTELQIPIQGSASVGDSSCICSKTEINYRQVTAILSTTARCYWTGGRT